MCYHAKDLVRRPIAARTRTDEGVAVGQTLLFCRRYATSAAQRAQASRGCCLGRALVIGRQGLNVWLSFASRCYLVMLEHIRAMAPGEHAGQRPKVSEAMDMIPQAARSNGYNDFSGQQAAQEDLQSAADLPPVADGPANGDGDLDVLPPPPFLQSLGWSRRWKSLPGRFRCWDGATPHPRKTQVLIPKHQRRYRSATLPQTRRHLRHEKHRYGNGKETCAPLVGSDDDRTWDPRPQRAMRPRARFDLAHGNQEVFDSCSKKQLDREVPYSQIPEEQRKDILA